MTNQLERKLNSLKELLDSEIADSYLADSSVIGRGLLLNNSAVLRSKFASDNNVNRVRLREELRSAEAFVDLLRDYETIGATNTLIEEEERKTKSLEKFLRIYGGKRNFHISRNGHKYTKAIEKDKRLLSRLVEKEKEAMGMLKQRVETPHPSVDYIERIVKSANSFAAKYEKNQNDESIISRAIQLAYEKDKHVAVITRDHRFRDIVFKTQSAIFNNSNYAGLSKFLDNGNLTIIFGEKEVYNVDYNTGDFAQNLFNRLSARVNHS